MSIPLSKEALGKAFVAFGFVGDDDTTQRVLLKLMAAIEAYLLAAGEFHTPPPVPADKVAEAIEAFRACGFTEEQAKGFLGEHLRDAPAKGNA